MQARWERHFKRAFETGYAEYPVAFMKKKIRELREAEFMRMRREQGADVDEYVEYSEEFKRILRAGEIIGDIWTDWVREVETWYDRKKHQSAAFYREHGYYPDEDDDGWWDR